jgi:uncharacterized protein
VVPERLSRLDRVELAEGAWVFVARSWRARLLGLAWLDAPPSDCGLLIPGCSSVHTFGMRFGLDVAFLDRDGLVLRREASVPPRRLLWCRGAAAVVERPAANCQAD